MSTHFANIGFPVEQPEDILAFIRQAAEGGRWLKAVHGTYILWEAGEGIEIWVQVTPEKEVVGCNPHFTGQSRMHIEITRLFASDENPLEGYLYGWVDPANAIDPPGLYPLAVEVPNFDLVRRRLTCPVTTQLQVAAFAHELRCFPHDDAFYNSQDAWFDPEGVTGNVRIDAEAFIPAGLSRFDEEAPVSPQPFAWFSGHVQHVERRTNPVTQRDFYYLRVQTYGGMVDVVTPLAKMEGEPLIGGVVRGEFWLSGRWAEELQASFEGWGI